MSPDELLAAACPPIARLGGSYYFAPETVAKGKELGVDGFRFYFLGRGGVLGDTSADVVRSAFGYFHPSIITRLWDTGRRTLSPPDAATAYFEAAADFGRSRLSGIRSLDAFVAAAEQVAAAADPSGLPLFAGTAAMPRSQDAPARSMQLMSVLRELRGSAHLAAVRAAGLESKVAHLIKRPDDVAMFGWDPADIDTVTSEQRAALDDAESMTDRIVRPAYAVLDEDGQRGLLDGVADIDAALA